MSLSTPLLESRLVVVGMGGALDDSVGVLPQDDVMLLGGSSASDVGADEEDDSSCVGGNGASADPVNSSQSDAADDDNEESVSDTERAEAEYFDFVRTSVWPKKSVALVRPMNSKYVWGTRECNWGTCRVKCATGKELSQHVVTTHLKQLKCECLECGVGFESVKELHKHIVKVHPKKAYKCFHCPEVFGSKILCLKHGIHIHGDFRCHFSKECEHVATFAQGAFAHLANCHRVNMLQCTWEGCGKEFVSKTKLRRHMTIHSKMFECHMVAETGKLCYRKFQTRNAYIAHLSECHMNV